jgi:tripartite-type tricarboxylate transporter receptor subunit TctC
MKTPPSAITAVMTATLLIATITAPVCAQTYPDKPIRLILPMAPGGPTDILGRIIQMRFAERLGQTVVPDNRLGAGSNVGTEIAVKARPDGYTIVLVSPALAISPGLYKKLNYDPIRDLAPISLVAHAPLALVVRPSLPVKNLRELVDYARHNPGKLSFGTSGVGAAPHLAWELFKSLTNTDLVHVPYKGAAPALVGLMSGEVDMQILGPSVVLPQIQAGKVNVLAVLSSDRLLALPNVPTAKEAGIDNYVVTIWYGILAPAGTPRDIVNRLSAEWNRSAAMPETVKAMLDAQFEPLVSTPEQFSRFLKEEVDRWARVIDEARIARID